MEIEEGLPADEHFAEAPLPFKTESETRPVPAPVAAPPAADPQALTAEMLAALRALPDGVELPSQLFSMLLTRLGIGKGALLLFDPLRVAYAPWASRGYDPTTMHRLRISLGATESWNALANGAPLLLADAPSLAPYQAYFSSREFSSISRMFLTPFIAEEKLIAVLLATDLASPFPDDAALLACLAQVALAGANRIYAARASRMADAGIVVSAAQNAAETTPGNEMTRFISGLGTAPTRVLLVSLSLEDFSRAVIVAHPHLDPFRLHEDITYFLGSFLADLGRITAVRQGRFIVGLPDFDQRDLDLFLHQMAGFLRGLFGGNGAHGESSGPRVLKTASWPADGGELRGILDALAG